MTDKEKMKATQQLFSKLGAKMIWEEFCGCIASGRPYKNEKLFAALSKVIGDSRFQMTLQPGLVLYRAREVDDSDLKAIASTENGCSIKNNITHGYDEENSGAAPLGRPHEGRNNISGVAYFYAAENVETALAEVKPRARSIISVAKYHLGEESLFIDMGDDKLFSTDIAENSVSYGALFTYVMGAYEIPNEEYYKYSQILTEYFRNWGYEGIRYRSFYTGAYNYTFFRSNKKMHIFEESRLYQHIGDVECFWDFNDGKKIEAQSRNIMSSYTTETAARILKDLH